MWVRPQTILPERFDPAWHELPEAVTFAPGTLTIAKVVRSRAEMREGPGVQFKLLPNILQNDKEVIVLTPFEVWQKVIDPTSGSSGWVHRQTLSKPLPNATPVAMATDKLPIVFSIYEIKYGFEYPDGKRCTIMIPRGRGFPSLRIERGRELVWVRETNSVLWLDRASLR